MSRQRKVQCSRSRAVALIAAGAFTVAATATAATTTWMSGPPRSVASHVHEAGAGPLLTQMAYQVEATAAHLAAARQDAAGAQAVSKAAPRSPRRIAQAMLASFGWSSRQFSCLDPLWAHESGWNVTAYNAGSGAYGIPQALPGSRMADAGPDWQTSAATQIKWGLEYIKGSYGSPCGAWAHEQATGWY